MHKIEVNKPELKLENTELLITNFKENHCTFHIYGKVSCGINSIPQNASFTFYLHDQAHLLVEFLVELNNTTNTIQIYNDHASCLDLHYACKFSGDNELTINNSMDHNEANTKILIRAVEQNGTMSIKAEGVIAENTENNTYLEDIKAITKENNHISIKPNLFVKTNSVIANHNATISPVNKEELFYLNSKGIKKDRAIKMIHSGFLKSILKINELKIGGEE